MNSVSNWPAWNPPRKAMCGVIVAVASLVGLAVVSASGPVASAAADDRVVVLVSLDGFANFYLNDPKAHIPTMRRMMREGAFAERGLACSFPTVTWPNHTTLVTGVAPAKHGVLGNSVYDRVKGEAVQLLIDPVFDKDEIVKVPTVYDVAHAAGLKTAGVAWPATRNAKTLDWTVPDMMPQDLYEKYSTPGWHAELRAEGLPTDLYNGWTKVNEGGPRRDWMATLMALNAIRRHRANLVLLHLIELDHTQHSTGPRTGDAYWAVATQDDRLRDLIDGIAAAGLGDRATVIVVSDHGFFAINKSIHVNVRLRELGLVKVEGDKVVEQQAWCVANAGGAAVYIRDAARRAELTAQLKSELATIDGIEAVFAPAEFSKIGQATPDQDKFGADLWLSAKDGYSFSGDHKGNSVVREGKPAGTHGHLPHHPDMHGIFIAWGRGIRPGTKLGEVQNTQVAATIARLLNLKLPSADGQPVTQALLNR